MDTHSPHHNPQYNLQRTQPGNSTGSASRTRSESTSSTGTRSGSGVGAGTRPLPFPPREFADQGTKWLLGHPGHLRHLTRVLALDVSQLLDFAGIELVHSEQLSEPGLKQTANRIFRVPLRLPGGESAAAARGLAASCGSVTSGVDVEAETGAAAEGGDIAAAGDTAAAGAADTHPDPHPHRRHATVVLLVEHQSTQQRLQSLRLLSYMVRLWDLERLRDRQDKLPEGHWRLEPIIPLVFYTGRARILKAPEPLKDFVPSFKVLHFPVRHLPREALRPEESAFGQLLCLMRLAAAPLAELRAELVRVVPRMEALTGDDVAEWRDL